MKTYQARHKLTDKLIQVQFTSLFEAKKQNPNYKNWVEI